MSIRYAHVPAMVIINDDDSIAANSVCDDNIEGGIRHPAAIE